MRGRSSTRQGYDDNLSIDRCILLIKLFVNMRHKEYAWVGGEYISKYSALRDEEESREIMIQ